MDINLDAIFTFLFVVVIILSQVGGAILKKLKSKDRQTDSEDNERPGIMKSLVTHIKEEIEKAQQAAQPPPGQPTGWETLMTSSDTTNKTERDDSYMAQSSYRQKAETIRDDYPEDFSDDLSIDEDILEDEQLLTGVPEDLNPAVPPPSPAMPTPRASHATHRIRELRRAIIWSEILAPPVALRNEE